MSAPGAMVPTSELVPTPEVVAARGGVATQDETLAAVDARVTEVLDDLATAWGELTEGPADVLGEADLPSLARAAAVGGKRLRPLMVHWGWVAAGAPEQSWGQVVELGAALEMLHLFALVHDDVMDGSELRRGRPTVSSQAASAHRRLATQTTAFGAADEAPAGATHGSSVAFGDHIAILVGDLVHAEADLLVAALPAPVRAVWRTMMLELVLGQRRDLTGAALGRRDLTQALEVARLKSGSYTVQRPLQMGALVGGAEDALVGCLLEFGDHLGEAFGLRDDLLGTWGNPGDTGKSVDDDLATGKPTVLLALAEQRLDDRGRHLLALTGTGDLDAAGLAELRQAMDACGVRAEVESLIAREVELATAALDPAIVSTEGIAGLTAATHRIAWRQS